MYKDTRTHITSLDITCYKFETIFKGFVFKSDLICFFSYFCCPDTQRSIQKYVTGKVT